MFGILGNLFSYIFYFHNMTYETQFMYAFIYHFIIIRSDGACLTRAPLGYFYNAPHWGGGLFRAPL